VATWNLRDCAANDGSGQRISLHDGIAQAIKDAQVDIVVAEEVQVDSKKGGDIALLSVALAQTGWSMPYVCTVDPPGEDDLAIFSKYPIRQSGEFAAPQKQDPWPRTGIAASIDVGGKDLDVYGFHFKAMGDSSSVASRRAQALAIYNGLNAKYGPALSSQSIVLAGDFNTTNADEFSGKNATFSILSFKNDNDPSNDFLDTNYRYLPTEPTFVDSKYRSVLDHVFVSPVLARSIGKEDVRIFTSPKVEVPNAEGKFPLSDHNMVAVDVDLP
jgi:endonuclease/exonuclease/phosphatase family metal-dependent hydrolase